MLGRRDKNALIGYRKLQLLLPRFAFTNSTLHTHKMVRLKNRYLLVDILYPDPSTWPSTKTAGPQSTQLSIHSPTSDALTPGLLAKMVREEVGEMYGDWGVGKLGGASATGIHSTFSIQALQNGCATPF